MSSTRRNALFFLQVASGLLILSSGSPLHGVEFKSGENVVIAEDEVLNDDLYMTGDTMTVAGRVQGDVVAAGRVIRILGVVEGDLIAAAQAIVIAGEITDDVRIGGMTLKLADDGVVGDDLFAAGFSFESEPGGTVTGKTGISGYQAALSGDHLQGLEASLVGLRVAGSIQGPVQATVRGGVQAPPWMRFVESPIPFPTVAPGLELAAGLRIEGDLTYRSATPAVVDPGAVINGATTHIVPEIEPVDAPTPGSRIAGGGRWLVVLALLGCAWLWLAPGKLVEVSRISGDRPLASLGWGLVALLGLSFGILLMLVLTAVATMAFGMVSLAPGATLTLAVGLLAAIGLPTLLWLFLVYVAPIVIALAGGSRLLLRLGSVKKSRYLSLVLGLVILSLLAAIPAVGPAIRGLVGLLGLGAAALWTVRHLPRGDQG